MENTNFIINPIYNNPQTNEIAIKLIEYYLENKDAESEGTIAYSDLCRLLSFNINPRNIEIHLGRISHACEDNNLPLLSALVVNKYTRISGPGFFNAYCSYKNEAKQLEFWVTEFNKIHDYQKWNDVLNAYKAI